MRRSSPSEGTRAVSAPVAHRNPRVFYRAGPSTLYKVLVAVQLTILTLTMSSGVLLAVLVPEDPHLPLAAVCLLMLCVLGTGVALLLRPAFRVTTVGIEVRGYLVAHRLGWAEIAVVEIDRALMNRGATVVVLRDGRRIRSALTGSRFALYRGESIHDHGSDLLQPARPTRAAIDTHRRWLHGAL